MKTKTLVLITLCIIIMFCVNGCKNTDKPSPKNPVTLNMWHNYGGDMQHTMDELIDEFNSTVGANEGIVINVTAISSSTELNNNLDIIVNDDPGALQMPDIFTGYPKIAVKFLGNNKLANLDNYFKQNELDAFVPEFLNEGRFGDGGLYVLPIAKSTEILFLNQTLFDRFSKATGASPDKLSTFEGIAELSSLYYAWTDALTPDIPNDGKAFFTADSWFNLAEVGLEQMGKSIFDEKNTLTLNNDEFKHIFHTFYKPMTSGGVANYDGYSSDLSKTGDLVCSTGSSAGILFYGDTITYDNNIIEQAEYSILPYPTFEDGNKTAIQRGGGLIVAKNETRKEYAAAKFLKWLTAPTQNMRFISSTGYLPVTKQTFEADMSAHIEKVSDIRIKKMLKTVMVMYEDYSFFTAPIFAEFDDISKEYEKNYKRVMKEERENILSGRPVSEEQALNKIIN